MFGKLKDGTPIEEYELKSKDVSVGLITLGAGISYVKCPDRNGHIRDVTLGVSSAEELQFSGSYYGLTVGRFANRIAGGKFKIGDKVYQLAKNNGKNHLHGGPTGLSTMAFKAQRFQIDGDPGVKFYLHDEDGHEGYPGNLDLEITYVLKSDGSLVINYRATCDKSCPINLANHSYFNLIGEDSGTDVLDYVVQLACSRYLAVNPELIPTGEIRPVAGTCFDFTSPKQIGRDLSPTLKGYDHCFVLDENCLGRLNPVAVVKEKTLGRTLKVFSTMPAVQFYTGNFLHAEPYYADRSGFCLETEFFIDSPNHPEFPSCMLNPNEVYDQTTVYQFGCE